MQGQPIEHDSEDNGGIIVREAGLRPRSPRSMHDGLVLPQGAPIGGRKVAVPPRTFLQYLVNQQTDGLT